MEEHSTVIELIDESGNTVKFDLVMTFDYEGKRYAALLPIDNVENVEDDEVVLLEVVKDKSGENFVSIDNPVLLDEVFNEFIELFDEMADGDDEDDEQPRIAPKSSEKPETRTKSDDFTCIGKNACAIILEVSRTGADPAARACSLQVTGGKETPGRKERGGYLSCP